jgi:UDP-glucose 4-epimerase
MSILITGGCGYIGSHMVHTLIDAGERVVVLDDLSTGSRAAIPDSVPLAVGDVGDRALAESLMRQHDVSAIIHFAGSIVVPDSVRDPLGYYRNNTANSRTLLEAAVAAGVGQFIFSSTAAVYGNPDRIPITEDAPLSPMSPYGTSKLMTEMMLKDVGAAHGLRYVILRYFNVAGADPQLRTGQSTPAATHLIKVAVQTALGLRPQLDVFGTDYPTPDGTCIRDYIHVTDLVRAHAVALGHLRGGGESLTLNCGYGHGYSVLEVIEAVRRAAGHDFPVRLSGRRAGDPAAIVADAGRLRAMLGWEPEWDNLDRIVTHALAWERRLVEGTKAGAGVTRRAAAEG